MNPDLCSDLLPFACQSLAFLSEIVTFFLTTGLAKFQCSKCAKMLSMYSARESHGSSLEWTLLAVSQSEGRIFQASLFFLQPFPLTKFFTKIRKI